MIELKNVSFSYTDSAGGELKNIDLTIPDGQCVILCGRSGCGKTTLTRLINGLIPQFFDGELSGEVLLDGENISSLPMYRIAEKVGSVFQNPRTQFFNVDTDGEIAFGIENEAVPQDELRRRVSETAEALHIESLLGRSIFALSGGEKAEDRLRIGVRHESRGVSARRTVVKPRYERDRRAARAYRSDKIAGQDRNHRGASAVLPDGHG